MIRPGDMVRLTGVVPLVEIDFITVWRTPYWPGGGGKMVINLRPPALFTVIAVNDTIDGSNVMIITDSGVLGWIRGARLNSFEHEVN